MAGETYYFSFSIVFVEVALLWLINLIWLRASGKTTFGLYYKRGTPEYKRVVKLASNRNISVCTLIALAFVANLSYGMNRLMHFKNPDYAQFRQLDNFKGIYQLYRFFNY